MFCREVNYIFLYNSTLSKIFIRKFKDSVYKKKLFNIELFFLYKLVESFDFESMKLFNNFMMIWLIFNLKLILLNLKTNFKLNVYYKSAIYKIKLVKFFDLLIFLDILLNLMIPVMKRNNRFVNQSFQLILNDFSFFVSTKVGVYFYVENVVDKLVINFSNADYEYLSCFKLYVK